MCSLLPLTAALMWILPLRSVWSMPQSKGTFFSHLLCTFMSHAAYNKEMDNWNMLEFIIWLWLGLIRQESHSLHMDVYTSDSVSSNISHRDSLSTVHELCTTVEDPSECVRDHSHTCHKYSSVCFLIRNVAMAVACSIYLFNLQLPKRFLHFNNYVSLKLNYKGVSHTNRYE